MTIVETQIRLSNWKIHVQKQVDAFKILIFWYQYQYFEILISILILILLFGRYWSWYWYWHQEKYWSWYWSWSWFFGRETIDIDIDIEIFIWKNIDLDIDPKFDIVPPLLYICFDEYTSCIKNLKNVVRCYLSGVLSRLMRAVVRWTLLFEPLGIRRILRVL